LATRVKQGQKGGAGGVIKPPQLYWILNFC